MSKAPDFGYLVTCPLSNDFSQWVLDMVHFLLYLK
jgi:hypothetical protein